ncbi:MAG: hypothetical protein EXR51_03650 [Dehalococcoidia bacterium]|nr:hypothetical protein [Dehalococcoidia bacterium]
MQFATELIGASGGALSAAFRRWRSLGVAIPALGLLLAAAVWEPAASASGAMTSATHGTLNETGIVLTALSAGLPRFAGSDSDTAGAVACDLPIDQSSLAATGFFHQSDPLEAPHRFNAIGLHWDGYLPEGSRLTVGIRAGEDGILWSPWVVADELDALRGARVQDTDLVILTGRYVQYRLIVEDAPSAWEPRLDAVRVSYIDSSAGPTAEQAASSGSLIRRVAALLRPGLIGRGAWGANESLRYAQGIEVWPRSYSPAKKIIVHHTASTNSPTDPAAVVRAIYYYHGIQQGWGDIGYNYLIDDNGRVFEGRSGGANIVGGHAEKYNPGSIGIALIGTFSGADPSPKALAALEQLVISKAVEHGFDPQGRSFFVDKETPNVMGHRDVMNTACPGERMYALLPSLRDRVSAGLPLFGQSWEANNIPKLVDPSATLRVRIQLKNSGTAAWTAGGTTPIRLGYRWFKPDGTPHPESTALELHTPLPKNVAPGETVALDATLKTPQQQGSFLLRWDMVQERTTWFEEQGNLPLAVTIAVLPFSKLSIAELAEQPNEIIRLLPADRLMNLPLSRLQVLSNDQIIELIPDVISLFPNERMVSFGNEYLLRYLPDFRLKSFSLDRVRTFPMDVQQRLGLAPSPTPTSSPVATATPKVPGSLSPTATPTSLATVGPVQPRLPSPTPAPTAIVYPTGDDTGGGVAR